MTQSVVASNRVMALWRTMIGKKVIMAVTGAVLIGFVIAHMIGNLKIFTGPNEINAYSRFLREVGSPALGYGELLWVVRIVLIAGVARPTSIFAPVCTPSRTNFDLSLFALM